MCPRSPSVALVQFYAKKILGRVAVWPALGANRPLHGPLLIPPPTLMVRNPQLVCYTLRTAGCTLFAKPGKTWRELRGKLTPTLSSGKLKTMFQIKTSGIFKDYLNWMHLRSSWIRFVQIGPLFKPQPFAMFLFLPAPSVMYWLGIFFMSRDRSEYILNTVWSVLETRQEDRSTVTTLFR